MSSLRLGLALLSTCVGGGAVCAVAGAVGCASTYAPPNVPPPRDFSVDDLATGTGGGGGDVDLAGGVADMASHGGGDLAMAARDLAESCLVADVDGFAARALWAAAPAAGGLFVARYGAGGGGAGGGGGSGGATWTAAAAPAGNASDVAIAAANGRPLVAARLADATLAAATFDGCRSFGALSAIGAGAATAVRPALVGGASADVVFRGNTSGDQRYYWAHFDGAAWGAIATQGNFLSTLPPTVVRVGGAVHAIFAGTDTNLWDGVVQAAGGGSSTQLTGNTSSLAPAAALAPDGKLHVVYTGTNKHIYWFVAAAPGTVHDLCDGQPAGCFIVTDFAPALAVASDGAPVTLWRGTDGKVYASKLGATTWGAAAAASGGDTTSYAPAIAGGGSSALVDVIYVRDGDKLLRHAQLDTGGWQPATSASSTPVSGAPALAAAP